MDKSKVTTDECPNLPKLKSFVYCSPPWWESNIFEKDIEPEYSHLERLSDWIYDVRRKLAHFIFPWENDDDYY